MGKQSGTAVSHFLLKSSLCLELGTSWLCYGLTRAPRNQDVEGLTPRISRGGLIWRRGLYRGNQVKMMSLGRL